MWITGERFRQAIVVVVVVIEVRELVSEYQLGHGVEGIPSCGLMVL